MPMWKNSYLEFTSPAKSRKVKKPSILETVPEIFPSRKKSKNGIFKKCGLGIPSFSGVIFFLWHRIFFRGKVVPYICTPKNKGCYLKLFHVYHSSSSSGSG
jgi:hypothetical protein